MWNQKRRNALIIAELMVVFLVLFFAVYFLSDNLSRLLIPINVDDENVATVGFYTNDTNRVRVAKLYSALKAHLKNLSFVEGVSYSGNSVPFDDSYNSSSYSANGIDLVFYTRFVDPDFAPLLKMQLLKGRWPEAEEAENWPRPVVITEDAGKILFGEKEAIGMIIKSGRDAGSKKEYVVTGVLPRYKQSDYESAEPGLFTVGNPKALNSTSRIIIKVKRGMMAEFFSHIETEIYKVVDKDSWFLFRVNTLSDMRATSNASKHTEFYTRTLISAIVILNILLGFIGVLWYNINLRRKETGLRMAVGASRSSISSQLIKESLVLGFFGVVPALILILQVYLLRVFPFETNVFFFSLAVSLLVLPSLLVIAAWYPGRLASRISPAVALHSE